MESLDSRMVLKALIRIKGEEKGRRRQDNERESSKS